MTSLDLVQSSRTVQLLSGNSRGPGALGNALTLFFALSRLGKSVRIGEDLLSHPSASWLREGLFQKYEATVRIQGVAQHISKISYEKDNQDLRLRFSLHTGSLKPESVFVETDSHSAPDLTIIVGEEQGSHNPEITTNPHAVLRGFPAALEATLRLLSPFQIPQTKLLARALSILAYDPGQRVCVFALEKRDFRNTQTNPKDVAHVLRELDSWSDPSVSLVALVESSVDHTIHGIVRTQKEDSRAKLSRTFPVQQKGSWTLFLHPWPSMARAREHVTSLL